MKLIGMLDSPYVRRSAISMRCLGIEFEHESISVLREFEAFQQYNPVVKAPSLVCDNGEVLMDSTLIIDYAQAVSTSDRLLMPVNAAETQTAYRHLGLALAACEKTAQIYYETSLRPEEKQHRPWLDRIEGQLTDAMSALEQEFKPSSMILSDDNLQQSDITVAVAWRFCHMMVPEILNSADFNNLVLFSDQVESFDSFKSFNFE